MSLDLFQNDQNAGLADAATRIAPDLTVGFADTFDAAVTAGIEWHNSAASQFAREHAMADYIGYVRDKTGETLPNPAYLIGGGTLDAFNEKQAKIAEAHPDLNLMPLSPADVETMTARRMAAAHDASKAMDRRERAWGATAGSLLGSLVASPTDPVFLATLPLGGMGELGIVGRALEFGALGAGTEAGIDLAQIRQRERAVPGSSKEIPGDIATAGAFGFALGGAFGAMGKWLKAGEKPLPTSLQDEVNVGSSDAQLAATNIFPTAEGEMAANDALAGAVKQAASGDRVTAGDGFDPAHVRAFSEAVGARTAAEIDQAAEKALRPISWREAPEAEHFDRIPMPGEETSAYWDDVLERATPAERRALGDLPDLRAAADVETGQASRIELWRGSAVEGDPLTIEAPGLIRDSGLWFSDRADRARAYADNRSVLPGMPRAYTAAEEAPLFAEWVNGWRARRGEPTLSDAEAAAMTREKALAEVRRPEVHHVMAEVRNPLVLDEARPRDLPFDPALDTAESYAARLGHDAILYRNSADGGSRADGLATNVVLLDDSGITHLRTSPTSEGSLPVVPAPDLAPAAVAKLADEPATADAVQKALIDFRVANPEAMFSTQTRLQDGTFQLTTRRLADVMDDLDQQDHLARELMTCAIGAAA